jgi:transcription elongation factor Elf1
MTRADDARDTPPDTPRTIPRERAERIARAHACVRCKEYSYKKLTVKPAPASHRDALGVVWHALLVCGVCGTHQELGIDGDGDVVYVG